MRIPGIPYVQGRNDYKDADGMHYGIAIHNTSNNASDENEASFATRRTDGTSAHFYVDKDSVTQSLDTNARSGHAGSSQGNQNAISFELTGGNATSRAQWLAGIDWAELGRVIAYILVHDPDYKGFRVRRASVAEMRSNPKVKAFYGHDDMRRAWGGTTHTDPGPGFPWDKLFSAVNAALHPATPAPREDDGMRYLVLAREKDAREVFVGDGVTRRWVRTEEELAGLQWWMKQRGAADTTVHEFAPGTLGVLGEDVTVPPTAPAS